MGFKRIWIVGLGLFPFGGHATAQSASTSSVQQNSQAVTTGWCEPVTFIRNAGQFATPAKFVARFPGGTLRLEDNAFLVQLFDRGDKTRGTLIRMTFEGASSSANLEGQDRTDVVYSYFRGDDPALWQRDVGAFAAVRYGSLYEGIDLVVREEVGMPKYDVFVAPGADLSRFVLRMEGTEAGSIEPSGTLRLRTRSADLAQPCGRSWQVLPDGSKRSLTARFRLLNGAHFGLEVPDRDPTLPLVIDPGLVWSTYLGSPSGGPSDLGYRVAIGAKGDVYATGQTQGVQFPTTPGAYVTPTEDNLDIYVARLRSVDGSLMYSAIIGGTGTAEAVLGIVVDALGQASIAGVTASSNFPTTPGAFDRFNNDGVTSFTTDGFVTRLNPTGTDLVYSTFLGGIGNEAIHSVALDPSGAVVVGGYTVTDSQDFPLTQGAYQTQFPPPSGQVCFVSRLNSTGSALEWSTLLGFGLVEGLALDRAGQVTVVGSATTSTYFPVTPGALYSIPPSSDLNLFISRLSAAGDALMWSSMMGGSGRDEIKGCAIDARGDVYVTGSTFSIDYPTTPNALQSSAVDNGTRKGFVTRLHTSGAYPVYSAYLTATGYDVPEGIVVDPSGIATIVGRGNPNFPITPGALSSMGDLFVTRIHPTGSTLIYSTFVGGPEEDQPRGVALAPNGRIALTGFAYGPGFPTTPGSAQTAYAGGQSEPFICVLDMLPRGVESYSRSTAGCLGPVILQASMPLANASDTKFTCSAAPPRSTGWLMIGLQPTGPAGAFYQNARIWLDPTANVIRHGVTSDDMGLVEIAVPDLFHTVGQRLYAQVLMHDTAACPTQGGWCTSNALVLTAQ